MKQTSGLRSSLKVVEPNTVNGNEPPHWRITTLSLLCENAIQNGRGSERHDNTRKNGVGFQHFDGITARTRYGVLNSELWSDWVTWANLLSDRPFRREISFTAASGSQRRTPGLTADISSLADERARVPYAIVQSPFPVPGRSQ